MWCPAPEFTAAGRRHTGGRTWICAPAPGRSAITDGDVLCEVITTALVELASPWLDLAQSTCWGGARLS